MKMWWARNWCDGAGVRENGVRKNDNAAGLGGRRGVNLAEYGEIKPS
jgi:hypothetical protein